ncbi:hypothetical protein K450DRAFT_227312 [Umbelopsis ramanniana AG]|uniref:Uncharacterized protein n=1 Tax=Umbelopsis ramanniana AG TaxID=1314678 RepID=A0AAD5HHR7_UMBRA|nr:uncharacterized protein K450DRAFT_227312 [Umbelopsis ramanniana AG]KAI8582468.1 hypothetical protein K450DRAFT_227312 [Umbelopsis ramanniana AG]
MFPPLSLDSSVVAGLDSMEEVVGVFKADNFARFRTWLSPSSLVSSLAGVAVALSTALTLVSPSSVLVLISSLSASNPRFCPACTLMLCWRDKWGILAESETKQRSKTCNGP